jgi:CubicO group peptidase (beta-lactamase class C family)
MLLLLINVYHAQTISNDFVGAVKTFVTATMQCPQYKYPGISLSIVKDGHTILSEGYGHRDIQKHTPFTNETLIGIGSCSKSFTAVLLAILNDEGKLNWKDRVQKFVPEFSMADEHSSQKATITDLLAHRTGLPRHDVLLFSQYNIVTRQELASRIKYLEANLEFREEFQYNNIMYSVCGHVIERITGKSWEKCIDDRIFGPLKMKNSNTNITQSISTGNYATPHALLNGEPTPFPIDANKIVSSNNDMLAVGAPGGGIISNANDMSLWLQMLTSSDHSIISERNLQHIWTPVQTIRSSGNDMFTLTRPAIPSSIVTFAYGLGWMSMQYNNLWITFHGGTIVGHLALVVVVPKLNLGVSVITNIDSDPMGLRLIAFHIIDLLLGDVPLITPETVCQWPCNFINCSNNNPTSTMADQSVNSCDGDKLNEQLVGEYLHSAYGAISISLSRTSGLLMNYNLFTGQCSRWNNESSFFLVLSAPVLMQPLYLPVTVIYDSSNQIVAISIPFESAVSNILFTKIGRTPIKLPAWGIALIVLGGSLVLFGMGFFVYFKALRNKVTSDTNDSNYHLVTDI